MRGSLMGVLPKKKREAVPQTSVCFFAFASPLYCLTDVLLRFEAAPTPPAMSPIAVTVAPPISVLKLLYP
jgi:hypothetical protein